MHVDDALTETAENAAGVAAFLADPCSYFGFSYTSMHSLPREQVDALQREGVEARFSEQRERIPMLEKLASRQEIDAVVEVEDVVPLLFEHTMYKSYPVALLERRQFDKMTDWLDKLTAIDLSGFDASSCDSIDGWLNALAAETPIDLSYTSGTSGTMSFFPWSRPDLELKYLFHRIGDLQAFGDPASAETVDDPVHYIGSAGRHRHPYMATAISRGADAYVHLRDPDQLSADLLWLAARLRLAAARGDASRVAVPESLLARRDELVQHQTAAHERDDAWLRSIGELQGERVCWIGFAHDLHRFAVDHLERGVQWSFAPGSALTLPGGTKGNTLPADWLTTIGRFVDLRITLGYGMTELSGLMMMCTHSRYHLQPWVIPFILDPDTANSSLERESNAGARRFSTFSPANHWGGLLTGDELEIDFSSPCGCGATSVHIAPDIGRLSDKRGGSDKITCAATPQAHAEAMEFLVGY